MAVAAVYFACVVDNLRHTKPELTQTIEGWKEKGQKKKKRTAPGIC